MGWSNDLADLQRLPATGGGPSASQRRVNRRGVSGLPIPGASRPPEPLSASATVHYFARRPVSPRPLAGLSVLPTGASPPAACRWLVTCGSPHGVLPAFGVCAQPESVASHRGAGPFPSWAFAPPSRLWPPGLSAPLSAAPLVTFSLLWLRDCSRSLGSRVFSGFPPGCCAPLSPAKPAALAFSACSHTASAGSHPPRRVVCVGLTSAPAKQAAWPSARLPSRVFPADCPPAPFGVGAPPGVSHTLRGFSSVRVRGVQGAEAPWRS